MIKEKYLRDLAMFRLVLVRPSCDHGLKDLKMVWFGTPSLLLLLSPSRHCQVYLFKKDACLLFSGLNKF